ncbi:MAG: hypothetical protein EAZ70_02000 [Runella slithyformis]|nr:MAG: hypothetical protein EAZ70_02000 [Runella slithyformis]TAF48229.1 MAG: hypothetical protein EAZ63_06070 [Runella slithyformis]
MITVRQEFADTFAEIDYYFEFIKKIDEGYTNLQNFEGDKLRISTELLSILKANAYLLLYNVIEATIRNAIWEIFIQIKANSVHYKDLRKEIREILIGRKIELEFKTKDDTIIRQVHDMIEKAFQNSQDLYPPKRDLKISAGSLTTEKIREALKKYGVGDVRTQHTKEKEVFDDTKQKRNNLAHGEITFQECGKPLSYLDLEEKKKYIKKYLTRVLDEVESYLLNQQYKTTS